MECIGLCGIANNREKVVLSDFLFVDTKMKHPGNDRCVAIVLDEPVQFEISPAPKPEFADPSLNLTVLSDCSPRLKTWSATIFYQQSRLLSLLTHQTLFSLFLLSSF